jgi:hypothetical protein
MRQKLISRLSGYWKMEAANTVWLAILTWVCLSAAGDAVSPCVVAAFLACTGLLLLGAATWRMELAQLSGQRALASRLLRVLGPSRPFAFVLALLGVVAGIAERMGEGAFTPSAIAATVLGAVSVVEYVNYYVVQLQHFDNAADFRRLMTGQGFKTPHLRRAVEKWRRLGPRSSRRTTLSSESRSE